MSRAIEAACLAAACALLIANAVRFWRTPSALDWWTPFAIAAAALCADFVSGLVHWGADTWGRESMPVLGPRFLRPFRVHHVNPDDMLARDVIDLNGDVAMLTLPALAGALLLPLTTDASRLAAVWLAAFAAAALPTNQIHQWAHMPNPPRIVARLQRWRILLNREEHARHHAAPFATFYCITTGWCNHLLAAIGFFPALERLVRRSTGVEPRRDELDRA